MRSDQGATIFCTQYNTEEWYERINPNSDDRSPISEAIMDRIAALFCRAVVSTIFATASACCVLLSA